MANDKDFKVKNDLNVGGDITVVGTVDGRDVATDGTKLDTIETNAKDDQSITAGSGLTGGGTGDVTLNVGAGTGITVNANDIAIAQPVDSDADVTFATVTTTGDIIVGGDLQVSGTTTTIDTQELHVTDNMIYMADGYADSAGAPTASVDIGFAAGVNDNGSYEHVGFFRDATDDRFKVFKGYTPEPDAAVEINTGHASFSLADLQAATFYGALSGNASTASQLQTTRTIALSGDVTGSTTFNGSGNATISTTIAANSVALGTDTTGNYVATITGTTNEVEVSGSGSENAGVTIGLPNDVTIGNDLSVTNNISMSGGNFYFDGTTTYLRSDTPFYFLTDAGGAQVGSFKGLQVSTSYSGTPPNNGILFGTDTTLYRSAANTLSTGTGDGVLIPSGQLAVGTSTFSGVINAHRTTNGSNLVLSNPTSTSYAQIHFDTNSGDAYIWQNGSGYTGYGGASSLNIYNSAGNAIAFHPGNQANTMYMSSGGNVGINTTSPGEKLQVGAGNIHVGGVTSSTPLTSGSQYKIKMGQQYWSGTKGTDGSIKLELYSLSSSDTYGLGVSTNELEIQSQQDIGFYAGGSSTRTKRMHIEGSNGNVGIGVSSPQNNLHISGGSSSRVDALFTYNAIGNGATDGMQVGIQATNGGYNWVYENLAWYVGTNNTRRMTVAASGNVGIGTSSPSYKLQVGNGSGTSPHLFLDGVFGTTNVADHARIYFNDNNFGIGAGGNGTSNDDDLYIWAYNGAGRDIRFAATTDGASAVNSGSWTTNVIIKNDGDVGIGTTSPSARLDVYDPGTWDIAHFSSNYAVGAGLTLDATNTGVQWSLIAQGTSGGANDNNLGFHLTSAGTSGSSTGYKFTMTHDSRFGIGTSSPSSPLHVVGNSSGGFLGGGIRINDTNNSSDWFIGAAETGKFQIAEAAGSTRMVIDTSGNVGFGTSPSRQLHVYRSGVSGAYRFLVEGNSGHTGIEIKNNAASNTNILFRNPSYTQELYMDANGKFHIYRGSSALTVDQNLNVGIGTTSPSTKLHVNGNSALTGGKDPSIGNYGGDPAAVIGGFESTGNHDGTNENADASLIVISKGNNGGNSPVMRRNQIWLTGGISGEAYNSGAQWQLGRWTNASVDARSKLVLSLADDVQSWDHAMTWMATGSGTTMTVIGQDSYSYTSGDNSRLVGSYTTNKLHVNGSIQLTNNNDAIVIGRGTASFFTDEEIGFGWGGGWYMTEGTYLRVRNNKSVYSTGDARFSLFYDSNNTSYYANPAGFSAMSQIGIGTTSNHSSNPALYVYQGNRSAEPYCGIVVKNPDASGAAYTGIAIDSARQSHVRFLRSGALKWQIRMGDTTNNELRTYSWDGSADVMVLTSAGNLTMTGNVTAYSDISLKENIEVIPHALDKVKEIRGVTYNRNDIKDNPRHTGVIAQEVEKVLPEVVTESSDGIKNVAYGNMVGLLIEAIKEQQETIDKLQARVEALENN